MQTDAVRVLLTHNARRGVRNNTGQTPAGVYAALPTTFVEVTPWFKHGHEPRKKAEDFWEEHCVDRWKALGTVLDGSEETE